MPEFLSHCLDNFMIVSWNSYNSVVMLSNIRKMVVYFQPMPITYNPIHACCIKHKVHVLYEIIRTLFSLFCGMKISTYMKNNIKRDAVKQIHICTKAQRVFMYNELLCTEWTTWQIATTMASIFLIKLLCNTIYFQDDLNDDW